jgi:hypothetical protein
MWQSWKQQNETPHRIALRIALWFLTSKIAFQFGQTKWTSPSLRLDLHRFGLSETGKRVGMQSTPTLSCPHDLPRLGSIRAQISIFIYVRVIKMHELPFLLFSFACYTHKIMINYNSIFINHLPSLP